MSGVSVQVFTKGLQEAVILLDRLEDAPRFELMDGIGRLVQEQTRRRIASENQAGVFAKLPHCCISLCGTCWKSGIGAPFFNGASCIIGIGAACLRCTRSPFLSVLIIDPLSKFTTTNVVVSDTPRTNNTPDATFSQSVARAIRLLVKAPWSPRR